MNNSIVFVTPWLHDGGIERNLEIKAPWFAERGYRVAVATWDVWPQISGAPNPVLETLRRAEIPVIDLTVQARRHQLLHRAGRLAAVCAERQVDVIVGHETLANAASVLAKLRRGGRGRVVAEFHNAMIYPSPGFGPMMAACVRQLYRGVDRFLAVSDAVADEAAEFFRLRRDSVATVYNPFDPDEIRRLAARQPDIELPAEPFIVACGRLVKAKGFDDLIAAFSVVRRRRPMKLVILGEGPEAPALRDTARAHGVENDVLLPGFVSNPFAIFGRSAAFVLSSRYGEAFSRVLVEAMACGVPVIASRCRWGPEEVLAEGRYGRLFDVGNLEELVAALDDVVADPAASQALVAAGHRRVQEFSVEEILPRLEQVYFGRQARPGVAVPLRARPRAASTPAGS